MAALAQINLFGEVCACHQIPLIYHQAAIYEETYTIIGPGGKAIETGFEDEVTGPTSSELRTDPPEPPRRVSQTPSRR